MKIFLRFCNSVLLISSSIFAFGQSAPMDSLTQEQLTKLATDIRQQYAPDKRTALFEVVPSNDKDSKFNINSTDPQATAAFLQALNRAVISPDLIHINALPDSSVGEKHYGIVQLSVANLRATPRNQAELESQVLLGTVVDLLQRKNGYYRIRTPEGYISWVAASSLTPVDAEAADRWKSGDRVIFTEDYGHSYAEPSRSSLRVSDLVMGNILIRTADSANGFIGIQYPDGRKAFVKSGLVPYGQWLSRRTLVADSILKTAKTMIGLPYLWGGTSVKGVDCSGFTKTAYLMHGLVIPRDASQQVHAGLPIDILTDGEADSAKILQNLQPADLLFFAAAKGEVENPRITHVALYMGNGEFIHSSGTVRINSFLSGTPHYDDYHRGTLVEARRYIGQDDTLLTPLQIHPHYTANTSTDE